MGHVRTDNAQVDRPSGKAPVIAQLGQGLRAFAIEDYVTAAEALHASLVLLVAIGGSDAQRQLFQRIAEVAQAVDRMPPRSSSSVL